MGGTIIDILKIFFLSNDIWPLAQCLRFIFVAVIKHSDKNQLKSGKVNFNSLSSRIVTGVVA